MQSEQAPLTQQPDASVSRPRVDALERRRLLLRGVGKSAAVAAVVVPIQSFANISFGPALCTVSGLQSNVGSRRTGGTTANCRGLNSSHFESLENWPGYDSGTRVATFSVGGTSITQSRPFNLVFGGGSDAHLIDVIRTGSDSEKIWAAALLSAVEKRDIRDIKYGELGYFPYSPAEVISLYSDLLRREAAERLFVTISL